MSNLDLPPGDGVAVRGTVNGHSLTAPDGGPASVEIPSVGELAYDGRSDRVGLVMELKAAYVLLRPPGGGREWDVPLGYVHPADQADELRARVAELNAASRWGL